MLIMSVESTCDETAVAITENGPTFIEGNSFPSHAVPQFAAHYPDGIGILPEFRKFIAC